MESPLESKPGTTFKYSDINFITVGALVEKLSGQSLDVYAQQHIFTPLQMHNTTFHPFDRACGPHQVHGAAIAIDPDALLHPISNSPLCPSSSWIIFSIPATAPTAHDNEGTAETNPNFDHLLRGTVHDPTTRRMGGVAGHAGVFSTAADISLFAQALLDKLLHNTGPFPLKQSTLQLMTSPQQPTTAQSGVTIFTPDGKTTTGIAARGFGWDINTAFSRPRGEIFPIGSFGHTGFTGTSLWIDPQSNTYVILLSNAVHPRGNPPISALRGQVATAAARALNLPAAACGCTMCSGCPNLTVAPSPESNNPLSDKQAHIQVEGAATLTGIDVLQSTHFATLADIAHRHNDHLRIGLLTNQTGLDSSGHRTIDILHHSIPQVELTTLFSPEHGILGAKDTARIGNDIDPTTHLPVISLYGPKDSDRRPTHEALKDLDAVVIDLQDAGVRFYTYESVVGYFLEAAAKEKTTGHDLEIILLDRPNPINGVAVQGPVSDPGHESYINYMPLPIRHGLTLGELARYINGERRHPTDTSPNVQLPLSATLKVVPMQHWNRAQFFDDTRLPWTNPSPNLRSLTAATLYPGLGMLDSTNISVGRGTDKPFEQIGAPYIDAPALAAYLTKRNIPGVSFSPITFAVNEDSNHYPAHGKTIPGIALTLTDRNALDSPELGIEIISALQRLYPTQFNLTKTEALIVSINTMLSLKNNEDPRAISASWKTDLDAFRQRRQAYLLYP
jgi:uncharacterized protein YbbC (DUF1343 family)/CubicO group peptidase (beta-lactamase class C family)